MVEVLILGESHLVDPNSEVGSIQSQVVYSKQPKLGLTQEFVTFPLSISCDMFAVKNANVSCLKVLKQKYR